MDYIFSKVRGQKEKMLFKKRCCEIKSGYCADNTTFHVTIHNAVLQEKCFTKINEIIKSFVQENEMFFGFYRTDGLNLTKDEWEKCDKEIPLFFKENGEYRDIIETVTDRKGRKKEYSGYLMVSKAQVNEQLYEKLQWILQYYLETTFFVPKISFTEFETIFSNYMKKSTKDYIANGYTDFLFSYYDSGNFSVTFDPQKYDIKYVCEKVENIWNNQGTIL